MKKLMLALTISVMFAPSAFAAGAETKVASALPPFGKEKTIPAPQIAKKVLSNGLEVWVVPRKGLPRVDYVLAVRESGLAADDKDHPGFAKLLAGLLNEGTTKRDSRAIAELAQGYGGSVAASPGNDGIAVFANAVTSSAGPMMTLLAEVARMPAFPAQEVELAKANALQALRVSETTPRFRAERAISKAVYGEHPYGNTTETAESITSTTQELLRTEHARRFRPERSLLVITGRISQADAMKFAQEAFGDWKGEGPASASIPAFTAPPKPARILLQRDGSVQSTLRLGAPGIAATSPDYVPLRLAGTIIGGGFSSRVNTNLREEKGYTYGASAGARTMRNGGSIIGGADVRNEVTGAALSEYFGEYSRLGKELVPADEMDMNKRYVAGSYLITNQLQRAVASTLANNWLVGLPSEFLGEFVPAIQKVTPEQVRNMGKRYFNPETQTVVVVGDKAAVAPQLKQFGDFSVIDK